jgi:uncharacterized protein YndB with AHSA1/START domain
MMGEPGESRVVIRRRFAATREELFDAWTNPDGMRAWMCPGNIRSVEVRMDLRVGGALLIVMRDADQTYEHRGEFQIIDRPVKLAFTWTAAATAWAFTLVTIEFLAVSESETDLVLTHERFPGKEVTGQYRGGWTQIVNKLDEHLGSH